jgi:hypothetical protein
MNNTKQSSSQRSANFWDSGGEGNYWSTYAGMDADSDGIGDSPYVCDENDTDYHPLMNLYILGDVNHDARVNIIDIDTIARRLGTQQVDDLWNPFADLDANGRIDVVDIARAAKNFGAES